MRGCDYISVRATYFIHVGEPKYPQANYVRESEQKTFLVFVVYAIATK